MPRRTDGALALSVRAGISAIRRAMKIACYRVVGFAAAALLTVTSDAHAPPVRQRVASSSFVRYCKRPLELGSNRIERRISGGTSFVVEAVMDRYIDNCGGAAFDGDSWWGGSMQPPKLVLRDLVLSVDAVREVLPRSAYTYFAEPRCLQVERSDGRVKLVLKGADAGVLALPSLLNSLAPRLPDFEDWVPSTTTSSPPLPPPPPWLLLIT